jgi:hypothetical protein
MPKLLSHHENTQQAYRANSLGKVTASQIELLPTPHDVSPFDAESRNWRTPPRRIETMRATPYFEERKKGEDTQYTVRLRSQRFQIDGALWKDLRKQGGTLRVQYIKLGDNLSIALSIGKALRDESKHERTFDLKDVWKDLWNSVQFGNGKRQTDLGPRKFLPQERLDRLKQAENTIHAFRMNMENVITAEQIALLKNFEGQTNENQQVQLSKDSQAISFVISLVFILLLTLNLVAVDTSERFALVLLVILLGVVVIAFLRLPKINQFNDTQLEQESNDNLHFRSNIRYLEGIPHFEYRWESGEKETVLRLEGITLRMGEPLWNELRAIGGTMGVHYIKPIMTPILLSIQPLPLRDVPTEADLEQVIGVSDDGELVYSDDLIDDIPDGDVRRLKAGKDTPL